MLSFICGAGYLIGGSFILYFLSEEHIIFSGGACEENFAWKNLIYPFTRTEGSPEGRRVSFYINRGLIACFEPIQVREGR